MKDLGDYHDLYPETDMLLLYNVLKTFRTTCLEHYTLDPPHFFRLAWQACLKKTDVHLELITDPDMMLMFKQGTQGGITQAVHQYAQVNNKCMGDSFDPGKELLPSGLGWNSLYGWAKNQNLLTGRFKWVQNPDKLKGNISKLAKQAGKGYLLEVDASYPDNLHDLHNDLPFMCKKKRINGV